jgi:hypothetical protein
VPVPAPHQAGAADPAALTGREPRAGRHGPGPEQQPGGTDPAESRGPCGTDPAESRGPGGTDPAGERRAGLAGLARPELATLQP